MIVEAFGGTHQGRIRPINEDRFLCRRERGIFVVADGMGGHSHGDLASSAIVHEVDTAVFFDDLSRDTDATFDAIVRANTIIRDISRRNDEIMIGSTVASLVVSGERFAILWTGDSRVYRVRDGAATLLTFDHTEPNILLREGKITQEEADEWPPSSTIVHAIGVRPQPHIEVTHGECLPHDTFVLCSDGLTAHVNDDEIGLLSVASGAERLCRELVRLTLERGGTDNVSVVVAKVGGDG